jgi:hypothetical protein
VLSSDLKQWGEGMRRTFLASILTLAATLALAAKEAAAQDRSCWGQATAVFAQTGEMGEHASQQDEPRLGLARLARELFDAGVIDSPTLSALGAFVAEALGLEVDACQSNQAAVVAAEKAVAVQAACWGQASAVFAGMGLMGEHASQEPTPRLGLRNLARALAELGVIPDDSMSALGAFVAGELGLEIDACV